MRISSNNVYPVLPASDLYLTSSFCHTQNARYRRTMEDSSKVVSNFQDTPGNGYFGVFDGHAGAFAAKWCATNLYKILAQNLTLFSNHWSIPSILAATFDQVDGRLSGLPEYDQSGSTAAIVYIKTQPLLGSRRRVSFSASSMFPTCDRKRTLYTANVGDTRIVLCRSGVATRLAYDHRAVDVPEAERVRRQGGGISVGRVDGYLSVTRAFGDMQFKPYVSPRPYTTELALDGQDEFLILACDGVWDVCSDQEAVDLIRDIEDPVNASQQLVRHALFSGSTDNITCMVVRLNSVTDARRLRPETYREIRIVDTACLGLGEVPLKEGGRLQSSLSQTQQYVVPASPVESDTTVSEEEDAIETVDLRRPGGRKEAGRPPSVNSGLARKDRERQEDVQESSLDRYGRFKRIVHLEFDYEGDDCAIVDSD